MGAFAARARGSWFRRRGRRSCDVGLIDVHLEGHTASVAAAVGAADAGGVNGVVVGAARVIAAAVVGICLLYTSPSPRDKRQSRMPSSA